MTVTPEELRDDLLGDICRGCGKTKASGHSFCRACYRKLNPDTQEHLYRKIGNGYEEAFFQALSELGAKRKEGAK